MSARPLVVCAVIVVACGPTVPEPGAVASRDEALTQPRPRPAVLRVGTSHHRAGTHATIQAAVDAAAPGDWILIAPGDYHETGTATEGVLIKTPGLHLRGLDRNRVIVDGTRPGAPACSAAAEDQVITTAGRSGVVIAAGADGVSLENLTACNFLGSADGENGNQLWWNGGDGSGVIGLGAFHGSHLTASSTFATATASATYGIFVSNSKGPGVIERSYASNMSDSSFYVGACPDCNTVLREVHAQNSPQGFSGTNAGGHLILEDSEWDHNRVGIAHTTLASDDPPSPQNGACPDDPSSRCTIIRRNHIHDNNTPDTPGIGIAASVPVGTGLLISGGRNDSVRDNLVTNNGAWGILLNDYPDPSMPGIPQWCIGGSPFFNPPAPFDQVLGPVIPCYYQATGIEVAFNRFHHNGGFGNPSNGDLANATIPSSDGNCFHHNHELGGGSVTSSPTELQSPSVAGTCGQPFSGDPQQEVVLFTNLLCDVFGPASGACGQAPNAFTYPQPTGISLLPIPRLPGLDDPCDGVPSNPWCEGHHEHDD